MFEKRKLFLFCILFVGLVLRLYGNNWDGGWHLHPDERFLTMVGTDVKIPSAVSQYLDAHSSTFNPANKGYSFYVYGTFPLLINKLLAQYLSNDTYDQFNLQGRVISGCIDFLVIFIIFNLVALLEKKLKLDTSIKYVSAFLYAIVVLPIQLSHFFTVDTFLNFFCWMSFYFAVKLVVQKGEATMYNISLAGLFLGLGLACKISAVYFAPVIGLFILINLISIKKWNAQVWKSTFSKVALFIFFCYLAIRLGSPYYFETNSFFNPTLSTSFLNNIQTLKTYDNPVAWFPPGNQWIHTSPFLPIINLALFGVGPIYFLCAFIGFIVLLLAKKRHTALLLVFAWVVGFLIYQSIQFSKTMRYLIFIYPFLAFFAAIGLHSLFRVLKKVSINIHVRFVLYTLCMGMILIWPLSFMSIYIKDHSRVAASRWIYNSLPPQSAILTEYWDDPLPMAVQDPSTRNYTISEVHIFDPDTPEKWERINTQLSTSNYYIMSSNRGWGSIPKTPERYPVTSQFYKNMNNGKMGYVLIKTFASYPSLRYLGIPIDFPDQWAEESFTVYDHPLVRIFKKND